VTAQPTGPATADQATNDPTPLVPTPTTDHVTAREITEFLRYLAELRVDTRHDDPGPRAAFLTRKTALFTRITNQHTRTPADPPPSTTPPPPAPTAPEGHTR
jgi:hypothetical protein